MKLLLANLALWACAIVTVSGFAGSQQRLFNNAQYSLEAEAGLVLDTSPDGVLEIMPSSFPEPEPFLFSPDYDDMQSLTRWAISYTPYTMAGHCKKPLEIHNDAVTIAKKGFKVIKLFSTDCDVLPSLEEAARTYSIKTIPTVYISEAGINDSVVEQLEDILKWAKWNLVSLIVIGSEPISSEHVSPKQLSHLLGISTRRLRSAGYSGAVTTIEHPSIIKQHADILCSHLHVLASNANPYFDASIRARDAGRFVAEQLEYLRGVCGDRRDAYVLETGWPRQGRTNGAAVASKREQQTAIESMLRSAGSRIALSTFEDELWREPGEFDAEQFWGCAHLFSEK